MDRDAGMGGEADQGARCSSMSLTESQVLELYRNTGKEPPAEFQTSTTPKRDKYGRRKKTLDGIEFDSTVEAEAYRIMKLWFAGGATLGFELQPAFILQDGFRDTGGKWRRAVKYVADFRFIRVTDGVTVVVDAKGFKTPAFRIKEKLFRQKFPNLDLQIWDRKKVKELSRV